MWLDDCRIPTTESLGRDFKIDSDNMGTAIYALGDGRKTLPTNKLLGTYHDNTKGLGRFTPNLLVCDDMLNDGNVVQYNKTIVDNGSYLGGHREEFVGTDNNPIVNKIKGQFFSDKGTNSRYYDLDLWFDKMLERL